MSDTARPLTLGTAGHVDHGKTALVRALTGIDTDRLPEERARGISIALGYARLTLPSGRRLSLVDVPGHERFVRTMVAGATGVDCFLMVVAADDGVMPQSEEHAAVLKGLGVHAGLVAITKSDLADPRPAREQAAELLPGIPIIAVSARTGAGLDGLLAAIELITATVHTRCDRWASPCLHVDRVFTVRGAGTVVTGSLWRGTIGCGDELYLLPAGRRVRVRGVHVHDDAVERADGGQRVAVNLAGVDRSDVARGDVLTTRDSMLASSFVVDVALDTAAPRGRFQIHHGTREVPGRVVPLDENLHQLRLEQPLIALRGDRIVIRSIAPATTIGGGEILDPRARRHGATDAALARLRALRRGEDPDAVLAGPVAHRAAAQTTAPTLTPEALAAERQLRAAGNEPPPDSAFDPAALRLLREAGRAIRISPTLHVHRHTLTDVERHLHAIVSTEDHITLAHLRDVLHTSRRYALALLEHFDRERVTIRRADDTRTLRPRRTPTVGEDGTTSSVVQ